MLVRLVCALVVIGCGSTAPRSPYAPPVHHFARPGTVALGEPSDDCWRDNWPVRPCEGAQDSELAGLYGFWVESSGHRSFHARFLYDGCHVAVIAPQGPLLELAGACALTYGVDGYGLRMVELSVAWWACDVLIPYSASGLPPVAQRVDGRLVELETGRAFDRIEDERHLDQAGRDLVCVRHRVALPSECDPPEPDPSYDLPCWSPRTRRERIDRLEFFGR